MCEELKALQREILDLDSRARTFEDWLVNNMQSAQWYLEKGKYDDVLFRLDQKKQKLIAIKSGNITVPETLTLPSKDLRRNRGF